MDLHQTEHTNCESSQLNLQVISEQLAHAYEQVVLTDSQSMELLEKQVLAMTNQIAAHVLQQLLQAQLDSEANAELEKKR